LFDKLPELPKVELAGLSLMICQGSAVLRSISEVHEFSEMVNETGPIVEDPFASVLKISVPKILLREHVFPLTKQKAVPRIWLASLAGLGSVT
jgi:hypothetical protein